MRIAHVVNRLDPSDGGPPAVVARLAAAQLRAGHEVAICSAEPRDPPAEWQAAYAAISGFGQLTLHHWEVSSVTDRLLAWSARQDFSATLARCDFVHVHGVWQPALLQATNACRAAHVPYCITPHGMLSQWSMTQKQLKKQIALAVAWQRALNSACFLHLLNVVEREQVRSLKLEASEVIVPNGVDPDELETSQTLAATSTQEFSALPARFVLFVGRLHASKGLDVLCKAFARIAERHGDLHLVIVGPDFGFGNDLLRFIDALGLTGRAHVLGPAYGARKVALLRRAECLCLPSRQEGFSVTVLEALACGVPVVISRACNFVEVEQQGAGIITSVDPEKVAEALDRLCGHPQRLESSRAAAMRLVGKSYTWGALAADLLRHYEANLRRA